MSALRKLVNGLATTSTMRATCGLLTDNPVRQSVKNENRRSRLSCFSRLTRGGPLTPAMPSARTRYHQRERSTPSGSARLGLSTWEINVALVELGAMAKLSVGASPAPGTST